MNILMLPSGKEKMDQKRITLINWSLIGKLITFNFLKRKTSHFISLLN